MPSPRQCRGSGSLRTDGDVHDCQHIATVPEQIGHYKPAKSRAHKCRVDQNAAKLQRRLSYISICIIFVSFYILSGNLFLYPFLFPFSFPVLFILHSQPLPNAIPPFPPSLPPSVWVLWGTFHMRDTSHPRRSGGGGASDNKGSLTIDASVAILAQASVKPQSTFSSSLSPAPV